ncbi:uncharacterized protein LOC108106900 [Drosophila eugracilis]|uniref:uncharacterized protein LOC108106900 n=1 Tax=Drosophila eugracilis TaxID=29029 RepID=UPI001BDA7DCB|nr:uncharacterized protein LOC108106900 [Drosophila eugracilis]
MTNRLALHHILTTQLQRDWDQEESAKFRLSQLNRRDRIKASLRTTQLPGRNLLPDTRKTYDNMVARIHSTMKAVRTPRKPRPVVPVPMETTPTPVPGVAPPLPTRLVSKKPKSSKSGRIKGGANSSRTGSANGIARISPEKTLAAIKASFNQKWKGAKGINQQNRIREVLQQKNVLETMLMQHRKLQRDRQTIALDIQRMRADLDRIRNKLDTSLQSLNSTRTLFKSVSKTSSKKTIVQKPAHSMTPIHRRSNGKRKVRITVPKNRQSVLTSKAPILKRRVR